MKVADLKDGGVYVLTRDVTNPGPDRRSTRNWTCYPVWKSGGTYVATRRRYKDDPGFERIELQLWCNHDYMTSNTDGFAALVAALEPAPRTFRTVMFSINRTPNTDSAHVILQTLVLQGKVTLDDLDAAYRAWLRRPEEES